MDSNLQWKFLLNLTLESLLLALGKCVLSSLCCTTNARMLLARQGHPGSRKHDKNMELKATYFNLFLLYVS